MSIEFLPGACTAAGGPYAGKVGANYPRNQWWVAATTDEVTRQPMRRWLLDLPVALYRTEAGAVVALDDRCPHRWAPLSSGWLEGDNIVCGYHGLRFSTEGRCVKAPTQANPPTRAKVHAYPVREIGPLVWIWTGDPALAADSEPHAVDWHVDPGWSLVGGAMEAEANYMLLKENVLDLTHFGYVHRTTFKILDFDRPPEVTVKGEQVEFHLEFPAVKLAPLFGALTGFGERPIARVNWGRSLSPALHLAGQDFTDPAPQAGQRRTAAFRVMHATTPISPTRMHYFWMAGWDVPLTQEQRDLMRDTTLLGFKEDKDMIEAIQATITQDPRGLNYPEIMVTSDQSAVQARRQLQIRLARDGELNQRN
ncbi:aromatic ring-hydroxylating dioxygenase subunit alpha [Massilia sp. METH4]|uniref:aromatic ring-hydroxylating dioxygenase subunit alpha n=1 Tax=Massilia sp. METH4 TaxID=3123041 RepID=UPI0030CAC657